MKLLLRLLQKLGRRTVCVFKGHVWYPPKCYPHLYTYYCLRCVKIIPDCPHDDPPNPDPMTEGELTEVGIKTEEELNKLTGKARRRLRDGEWC